MSILYLQNLVNQANEKVDGSGNISTSTPKIRNLSTSNATTAENENEQQRSSFPDITISRRDNNMASFGNSLSKTSSYEGMQWLVCARTNARFSIYSSSAIYTSNNFLFLTPSPKIHISFPCNCRQLRHVLRPS